MLKFFSIKDAGKFLATTFDKSFTFIPVMMIRALQMHPGRSDEIRARMVHVLDSAHGFPTWGSFSLVLFPTVTDFQHILGDTGSPLRETDETDIDISKSEVDIIDYKCTRGENGDIVLEVLRWDSEALAILSRK